MTETVTCTPMRTDQPILVAHHIDMHLCSQLHSVAYHTNCLRDRLHALTALWPQQLIDPVDAPTAYLPSERGIPNDCRRNTAWDKP